MIFLFHIFSYDIWFYVSHILLHKIDYLHKMHKIHHEEFNHFGMTFLNGMHYHIFEVPFQNIGFFVPLLFLPFSRKSFFKAMCFISFRTLVRHDQRWTHVVGNHHILHHDYPDYNFGEFWLDYLFGTVYPNNFSYIYGIFFL